MSDKSMRGETGGRGDRYHRPTAKAAAARAIQAALNPADDEEEEFVWPWGDGENEEDADEKDKKDD